MENKTKPTPDRYKTSQNPLVKCNSQNHYHKRVQSASQIQNHLANNQTNKKWRLDPQLVRVTYSFCDKRKTHRKKANYISEKREKRLFIQAPKCSQKWSNQLRVYSSNHHPVKISQNRDPYHVVRQLKNRPRQRTVRLVWLTRQLTSHKLLNKYPNQENNFLLYLNSSNQRQGNLSS